ncbi:MAG: hypothetical protein RR136_03200 [Clostridia bacterium]
MESLDIKNVIKRSRFKNYEVANKIGIREEALSRILRYPVSKTNEDKILNAINKLREEET